MRGFSNGSKPKESHSPQFVNEEFEAYLKCGRLEYGFLRVKCDACRHEKHDCRLQIASPLRFDPLFVLVPCFATGRCRCQLPADSLIVGRP